MKPKKKPQQPQRDYLKPELRDIVNPHHELVLLNDHLDWPSLEAHFESFYPVHNGRPGISVRLLAGLHLIKHLYGLSDEQTLAQWLVNPYFQLLCGEQYFQHKLPTGPSSMTRFRQRVGSAGMEKLLQESIRLGRQVGLIDDESLKVVVADTTVMEKAVAPPSDLRLLKRIQEHLVALAKAQGVKQRQTYERDMKHWQRKGGRYARAKQFKRLHKMIRLMAKRVGRLMRELLRKVAPDEALPGFMDVMDKASRLIHQAYRTKERDKLYSLHAPEVECIAKGKAHKPYEFGCKVSVVTTADRQFVLASHALHGNPYDGHTLHRTLCHAVSNTGAIPHSVLVDRGYRGAQKRIDFTQVHISGKKVGPDKAHPLQHRRESIEAIIGHMKTDGWLSRHYLKGELGDRINAILCGVGQNLRMLLKVFRALVRLQKIFVQNMINLTGIAALIEQIKALIGQQAPRYAVSV